MPEKSEKRDEAPEDPRRQLGARAEELCSAELERRGWRILDRNWRVRMGEIDIVATDGHSLVVVEVKAHRAGNLSGPVHPALAVNRRKQQRLRRLAEAWLQARAQGRSFETVRFDVVGITVGDGGSIAAWEHIEQAF